MVQLIDQIRSLFQSSASLAGLRITLAVFPYRSAVSRYRKLFWISLSPFERVRRQLTTCEDTTTKSFVFYYHVSAWDEILQPFLEHHY